MTEAPGSPREQAERWFARLMAPDCSAAERAAFEHWRGQAPEHAAAYAATERLLTRVDELAATDPRMQALLREAHQLGDRAAPGDRAQLRGWLRPLALAASVLVAVAGTWWVVDRLRVPEPVQYAAAAERRTIALDDGSTVELDVASRFSASFTTERRDIELEDGRAVFNVAPDKARPFTVRAGDGAVTAVGTRFQVERKSDQVTVILAEGIVSVSRQGTAGSGAQETRLQPGEQLAWSGVASDWRRQRADIEASLSWSRGRLVFRNTPLADVVDEVNRYSPRKLVLADPALAGLPVHGNFVAGDAGKVASALEAVLPLQADVGDAEIRLSRRH